MTSSFFRVPRDDASYLSNVLCSQSPQAIHPINIKMAPQKMICSFLPQGIVYFPSGSTVKSFSMLRRHMHFADVLVGRILTDVS